MLKSRTVLHLLCHYSYEVHSDDSPTVGMTDVMIEVALLTGGGVRAELVQMIVEPMALVELRAAKEEVAVATLGVVGVGEEMEIMEEEVAEVKKAKVGVVEVNQVAMEENPPE